MTQCATMIVDHIDRKSRCSREENHAGRHFASVVTDGKVQHVLADNYGACENDVAHDFVITVKDDDIKEECKSCGVTYIKRKPMDDYCSQCSFWLSKAEDFKKSRSEKITGLEDASLVTNDYECFSLRLIGPSGFSGADFSVGLLGSDDVVNIKGLWYCGTVPLHLRDEFEPNVRFVTIESW